MKTLRCQICGKPQDEAYRPFCSPRCANVDLQRWLTGRYAIAARDDDEADSAALGQDDEA